MNEYENNGAALKTALESYRSGAASNLAIDAVIAMSQKALFTLKDRQYHNLIILQHIVQEPNYMRQILDAVRMTGHIGHRDYERKMKEAVRRFLVLAFGADGIEAETWESGGNFMQKQSAMRSNTRAIITHYRLLHALAENAELYADAQEETQTDLLSAIRQSAKNTVSLMKRVDFALSEYKKYCFSCGLEEEKRRWRVLYELYLKDHGGGKVPNYGELARTEYVERQVIHNDMSRVYNNLSILLYGADSLLSDGNAAGVTETDTPAQTPAGAAQTLSGVGAVSLP